MSTITDIPQGTASTQLLTLQAQSKVDIAALEAGVAAQVAVVKRTVTIAVADLTGLANGVLSFTKALSGGALPANARYVGHSLGESFTGFDNGGGGATFTLKVGGASDDDSIVTTANVATGQSGFPKAGTAGVRAFSMCPLPAEIHNVILTSNVELNDVTAGSVVVNLFYLVLP